MITTFFYARRYSVDNTQEFDPNVDPYTNELYSIPDPIEDLEVDNFKINQALYDAFATTGRQGQVLLTDSSKVFWGDVSGVGTPLQTIGLYDEFSFQGVISNLDFIDGNDPDNLVKAKLGVSSAFGEIYISDRWSSVVSSGKTNIYRNSKVGIGNTNPTYDLDIFGNLRIVGLATITNEVVGVSTIRSAFITNEVVGVSTIGVASITNEVVGVSTIRSAFITNEVVGVSTIGVASITSEVVGVSTIGVASITSEVVGVSTIRSAFITNEVVGVASITNEVVGVSTIGVASITSEVVGVSTVTNKFNVGISGTVIATTETGLIGFGTNLPEKDIEFKNKDVFFNGGAIYDANENVGFRTEQYQVPRNVLTTVGVDTSGNIISGRFFDAANLIRLNLDFIANEAVGFITSTDYKNPAFSLTGSNYTSCKNDIKNILKAITYDITRGGNSQSVGAGLSYYNGNTLVHINGNSGPYSIQDASVVAITTAAQIARYVINNLPPPKSYQGIGSIPLIRDLTLQDDPSVGFNTSASGCSNVVSAITVCAGIVTTIIKNGPSSSPNITYPDGKILWAPAGADSRNVIYVSKYGNDDNSGRTEGSAKLTIGAAAAVANPGDTIMVRSGVYAENNPIGLPRDVTVSGQDLRLVTIYPQNDDDVFYVRRGCLIENLSFAYSKDPYNASSPLYITGAAVAFPPPAGIGSARSGYLSSGPADEGPSGRWRSPYIRNCTNFMSNSIGMKIDGNHATASTIGNDLKCMVCDSFTQYNQNGIGVSITNNGYAQLVSIFTINCNIAIYCDTGGSCDLTNSNSSFGNYGLVAVGLGSTEFTGKVNADSGPDTDTIVFKQVYDSFGNARRPYDGQALWFKINLDNYPDAVGTGVISAPMQELNSITVLDGGSGYSPTSPPNVIIRDFDGTVQPKGPQGIIAEASATVNDAGQITSIDVVSTGRNYLASQNIVVDIEGNTGLATAVMKPIYYTVFEATEPTSYPTGISTITFNEFIPFEIFQDDPIELKRISRILTSSHSFEYIGTGTDINTSTPLKGAVPIKENEVVAKDGAQIPFTSTDQKGNFDIGKGIQIDQTTSTIRGRDFSRAIQAEVTPLILALR